MTIQARSKRHERTIPAEKPHRSVPKDRPCGFCGRQVEVSQWLYVGTLCVACDWERGCQS